RAVRRAQAPRFEGESSACCSKAAVGESSPRAVSRSPRRAHRPCNECSLVDPRPVGMGRRAHRSSICFLENPMIAKKQETAGVGVESDDRRAIRSVSIAVLLVCACSFRAFAQPTGMRVDTDPAGAGKSSSYFPKIAYDSSGFVHVVWQDFRDPDWAI